MWAGEYWLTLAIQQGRELLARERGGNQNNRPRFMQETQEEVVETPDGVIDEEAHTMKFTSPALQPISTKLNPVQSGGK